MAEERRTEPYGGCGADPCQDRGDDLDGAEEVMSRYISEEGEYILNSEAVYTAARRLYRENETRRRRGKYGRHGEASIITIQIFFELQVLK